MKHIKLFEKFKEFNVKSLKNDIHGILVELKDIGHYIDVNFRTEYNSNKYIVTVTIQTGNKMMITGTDIHQYILTLIDYMKYKLDSKFTTKYLYWDIYPQEWRYFNYCIYPSNNNRKYYGFKIEFEKESN